MKRIKLIILAVAGLMVFGLGLVALRENVWAVTDDPLCGSSVDAELKELAGCSEDRTVKDPIKTAVNLVLWFAGVISVVMIIYAGVTMTTSTGDAGKVAKAKKVLLYAIIGLVVTALAYAIANFVVGEVTGQETTTTTTTEAKESREGGAPAEGRI